MAVDTDSVTMEHLSKMAPGVSNGHVSDDVTHALKVKVVPRSTWMQISQKPLEIDHQQQMAYHESNGHVN